MVHIYDYYSDICLGMLCYDLTASLEQWKNENEKYSQAGIMVSYSNHILLICGPYDYYRTTLMSGYAMLRPYCVVRTMEKPK